MFVMIETGALWAVFVGGVEVYSGSHRQCKRYIAAQEMLDAA